MKREDWLTIGKWIGYAYLPIAILVIAVFLLYEWNMRKLASYGANDARPGLIVSSTSNR